MPIIPTNRRRRLLTQSLGLNYQFKFKMDE